MVGNSHCGTPVQSTCAIAVEAPRIRKKKHTNPKFLSLSIIIPPVMAILIRVFSVAVIRVGIPSLRRSAMFIALGSLSSVKGDISGWLEAAPDEAGRQNSSHGY